MADRMVRVDALQESHQGCFAICGRGRPGVDPDVQLYPSKISL